MLALLPGGRPLGVPTLDVMLASFGWLLLFGLGWMPIVLWLTLFGGSRLPPGRVAVLLMLEVVIGIVSATWLTDEPFGLREAIGTVFVVGACGSEAFGSGSRPAMDPARSTPRSAPP